MNNREVSTEQPINNNYEGDKMHSSNQNTKSIKERLSDAILDINSEEVKHLVEQGGDDITQLVLSEALKEAYKTEVGKGDKKSKNKLIEIREFFEAKLDNMNADITAPSVDVSATISGREILDSDDEEEQVSVQPAEHTSEESAEFKKQPSNTQEQQEVPETPVPEQMNITQSEGASSSMQKPQDESATALPVDIDNKEEQALDQPTEQISLQTEKGEPGLESKDKQLDSPLFSPKSSVGSDYSKLESNNGQSGSECAQTPSDSNGDSLSFEKIDEELVVTTGNIRDDNDQLAGEDGQQNSLPPSPKSPASDDKRTETFSIASGDTDEYWTEGDDEDDKCSEVSSTVSKNPSITDVTDDKKPLLDKINKGVPTLKSNNSPQNTKSSNLHIIAASALAIAGIALGVAIAVYLEMLAVGIAVGACCLVAAAIIYCCNRPSSSLEGSNVEPIADEKLVV